jgi:hypothetical protein
MKIIGRKHSIPQYKKNKTVSKGYKVSKKTAVKIVRPKVLKLKVDENHSNCRRDFNLTILTDSESEEEFESDVPLNGNLMIVESENEAENDVDFTMIEKFEDSATISAKKKISPPKYENSAHNFALMFYEANLWDKLVPKPENFLDMKIEPKKQKVGRKISFTKYMNEKKC